MTDTNTAAPPWADGSPITVGLARGELRLLRLDHSHLDDFRRQYADPSIAELCCWPAFADDSAWHHWLAEIRAAPEHALFGLWHDRWGFIGCAGLVIHGDLALFHYWLGRDFRGRGHGTRTGLALLDYAREHWGLRACYAKVFANNQASRRCLGKIGFHDTGIRITSPAPREEHLLRWPCDRHDAADEARWLFAALEADIHVTEKPSGSSSLPDALLADTAASRRSTRMIFKGART